MSGSNDEKKPVLIRVSMPVYEGLFSDSVEETKATRKRVSVPSLVVDRLEIVEEMKMLPVGVREEFSQLLASAVASGARSVSVPLPLAELLYRLLGRGGRGE